MTELDRLIKGLEIVRATDPTSSVASRIDEILTGGPALKSKEGKALVKLGWHWNQIEESWTFFT